MRSEDQVWITHVKDCGGDDRLGVGSGSQQNRLFSGVALDSLLTSDKPEVGNPYLDIHAISRVDTINEENSICLTHKRNSKRPD